MIRSVVFSPDGKRIATASADKTVKIWDTKTGKELLTHYGHNGWVNDVAFSPDGKRLITASDDKTARQYMNDIDELLVFARNSLTRALTIEECQKYLSMKECPSTAMAISKVVEGKVQAQTGNIDSAVEHLKTALKLDPSLKLDPEKEAKQQYAFVLLIRGIALINVNNKKEAVNYIKKAVETNPDEDTLSNAGAIYHEPLYEYEAAYMAFKQALNINPRNNSNIANFAEANLATGRFKDAYNLAQEILSESDASQPLDISTQLAMRFIIISSLVMQGLTAEAKKELMEFINFYNDISKSYKNEWNYTGTTHFIKERIMDSRQKKLLLKLIEILKTQQPSFITARQFEELIK